MWGQSMGRTQLGMAQGCIKAGNRGGGLKCRLAGKGGCRALTALVVSEVWEALF